MPVFGELNSSLTIQQVQAKLAALFQAFDDLEKAYQWQAAYSAADLEATPLSWTAADTSAVMTALSDAHQLYMTAQGAAGYPTAALPYPFLASMRAVTGPR